MCDFTCNDDFEISDYIVKRSVLFNIDISNNGSGNQKVNSFISNLNNLTGDLYKCFYSRFSQRFQELLNELSEIRYSNESKNKDIPDIFKLGSEVLKDIFEEYDSIDDASYIKVYDSSFFRDGKSNLDERKKKFIDDLSSVIGSLTLPIICYSKYLTDLMANLKPRNLLMQ